MLIKPPRNGEKIVVGMSGGVDSSAALLLLKQAGWDPVGVSLLLPSWQCNAKRENACCTNESLEIAAKVCASLGCDYHQVDVKKDFENCVVSYFIQEYSQLNTPNPCVVCNRNLKFKELFAFAKSLGIKYVATGHYAKTAKLRSGHYQLQKAKDQSKDQTYNLCFLDVRWLPYIVFPLGDYYKKDIYQLVAQAGIKFFEKRKQSQDFCYLPQKSLDGFLLEKIGRRPGNIVDTKGNILGRHDGLHFFTIGQRKGIGLSGGPWYVCGFEGKKNELVVCKTMHKQPRGIFLEPYNLFSLFDRPQKVMAKVRYRQELVPATLKHVSPDLLKIEFKKAPAFITPGQYCVFYVGKALLGGGRIRQEISNN